MAIICNIGGKTGVGKTTLVNSISGSKLTVDHIKPCTKKIQTVKLNHQLLLRDFPGLGVSQKRDKEVIPLYLKELKKCDFLLYLLKADTRYIRYDQKYFLDHFLRYYPELVKKTIICLNQIDKIYPFNWRSDNTPSNEQLENVNERIKDIKSRFRKVFEDISPKIIILSALKKYNLQSILEKISN